MNRERESEERTSFSEEKEAKRLSSDGGRPGLRRTKVFWFFFSKKNLLSAGNRAALLSIILGVAALLLFSWRIYEPRALGLACVHGTAPAPICLARAGMAWLVRNALVGTAALVLGIAAFITSRTPLCAAAIIAGSAGILFYNVTWGALGAALGAWTWLGRR
jgi:hypothetical protein